MDRRVTNAIRWVMDELLPPIVRDSRWFMWGFFHVGYKGVDPDMMMDFKKLVWDFTPEQYAELYRNLDTISRNRATDLNQPCIDAIRAAIGPDDGSLLDVGCGSGFLVRDLKAHHPHLEVSGLDIVEPPEALPEGARFIEADIGRLKLEPRSYDVITCCHVLEHLLDYRRVMDEIVAAARKKVIFVVPRQRPYYYTLDEHVNFFLFPEKFAYEVGLRRCTVQVLAGDLFYVGETA